VSAARPLLCDLLRAGAAQAFSDKAKFALKKVDRFADTAVAAETIFGERSIDLVGEPQWIVAVLFGTGHSLVPDALIAAALARWIACICAPRVVLTSHRCAAPCDFKLHEASRVLVFVRTSRIGATAPHSDIGFVERLAA
jgi:hypothetical protein